MPQNLRRGYELAVMDCRAFGGGRFKRTECMCQILAASGTPPHPINQVAASWLAQQMVDGAKLLMRFAQVVIEQRQVAAQDG